MNPRAAGGKLKEAVIEACLPRTREALWAVRAGEGGGLGVKNLVGARVQFSALGFFQRWPGLVFNRCVRFQDVSVYPELFDVST